MILILVDAEIRSMLIINADDDSASAGSDGGQCASSLATIALTVDML